MAALKWCLKILGGTLIGFVSWYFVGLSTLMVLIISIEAIQAGVTLSDFTDLFSVGLFSDALIIVVFTGVGVAAFALVLSLMLNHVRWMQRTWAALGTGLGLSILTIVLLKVFYEGWNSLIDLFDWDILYVSLNVAVCVAGVLSAWVMRQYFRILNRPSN